MLQGKELKMTPEKNANIHLENRIVLFLLFLMSDRPVISTHLSLSSSPRFLKTTKQNKSPRSFMSQIKIQ